jgi:hypothetical protein
MRTCARCDGQIRARGLCNRHYLRARQNGFDDVEYAEPVQRTKVEEWARAGENPACIDCGDKPLFGGLRCLDCFQVRCERRQESAPKHKFVDAPSHWGYNRGCRCRDCMDATLVVKRRNRAKTAA